MAHAFPTAETRLDCLEGDLSPAFERAYPICRSGVLSLPPAVHAQDIAGRSRSKTNGDVRPLTICPRFDRQLSAEREPLFRCRIRTPIVRNEERRTRLKGFFRHDSGHFLKKQLAIAWVIPKEHHRVSHGLLVNWLLCHSTLKRQSF